MLISLAEAVAMWDKKRWPNFLPSEMACRGCGEVYWAPEEFDRAQRLRTLLNRMVHFNSTHRSAIHNARVGGAPMSMHKKIAFDFSLVKPAVRNDELPTLQQKMVEAGFTTFGLYGTFIHTDSRPGRFWVKPSGQKWEKYFRRI